MKMEEATDLCQHDKTTDSVTPINILDLFTLLFVSHLIGLVLVGLRLIKTSITAVTSTD